MINKLLDNLEKCKDRCQLSLTVRTLNGENNLCGCEGLTCDKCEEQAKAMLGEWRKELNDNGWIPVEERLPKHLERALTCDAYGNMHIMSHYQGSEYPFGIDPNHHRFYEVVAWQPLPQPYRKEKTDD